MDTFKLTPFDSYFLLVKIMIVVVTIILLLIYIETIFIPFIQSIIDEYRAKINESLSNKKLKK